jgi:hypothetical protein
MMEEATKTGAKTSEFWLAALMPTAAALAAILVLYGYISNQEADAWLALVAAIIPAALALAGIKPAATYIESRSALKRRALVEIHGVDLRTEYHADKES